MFWAEESVKQERSDAVVYLCFRESKVPEEETFLWELYRLGAGPFDHCELMIEMTAEKSSRVRYVVGRATTENPIGKVFKLWVPPENNRSWVYLQLLCRVEQTHQICSWLESSLVRGDYYSMRKTLLSGAPRAPGFVYDLLLGKHVEVVEGATALFCGMHALLALQAGGFLKEYPAEKCNASDLFALAVRYCRAVLCESPFPRVAELDSTGNEVSSETQMLNLV